MNCQDFRASRLAGLEGEEERRHLEQCAGCRSRLNALDTGRGFLEEPAVWEEPPPELGSRVTALITALPHQDRPRRSWRLLGLVSAAAVIIAIVGILMVVRTPSPDWEVAIPSTERAPLAQGTIAGWNHDTGTRLRLRVDGLEPAPEGFVYELWLSNESLHVSAGTFTDATDVEMTTGVARSDYPRLWVTLEPLDDDESPSGDTVLDTHPH
ncbi:MAG: hypothetical protein GEU79_09250 [Acidimicrobiia bacterium]|nr:hypothetical protein [Acidimicrobiia bacterium]